MVGTAYWDTPLERETLSNAASLLNLREAFGYPIGAKVVL